MDNYIKVIKEETGVNVNRCYQCGKCSAGCAMNEEMDFPPSLLMRMLQTRLDASYKEILQSQSIWLCVSCQNCVTRCPMEIDIPALTDYLREEAVKQKTVNKAAKDIVSFHQSFLDSIRYTGRLYEIGLIAGYKMRSKHLLQDVPLVPAMLKKGKLPIVPEIIKDKNAINKLFKASE